MSQLWAWLTARVSVQELPNNKNAELVVVGEPDKAVAEMYTTRYHLASKLMYTDTETMLNQQHPRRRAGVHVHQDHRKVIEIAAAYGVLSTVEKPLSKTMEDAFTIPNLRGSTTSRCS